MLVAIYIYKIYKNNNFLNKVEKDIDNMTYKINCLKRYSMNYQFFDLYNLV